MTQAASSALRQRPSFWRRRFYVHALQKRYAVYFGIYLFSYSVLIFGLVLLAMHIVPVVKLYLPLPIEVRAVAASQFLAMAESLGPAVIALIVASAFFSVYLTHKIAGPLYRLEKHAAALAQGDLSIRIRLRAGDELHELADMINEAVERVGSALTDLSNSEASRRAVLEKLCRALKADPTSDGRIVQQLELILKDGEHARALLERFRLSAHS